MAPLLIYVSAMKTVRIIFSVGGRVGRKGGVLHTAVSV